ncbi:hypothetical protein [Legionella cardiaca]|uniref:Uncharacterized protein n=1 Tax=Legionella cardiaca TaxID=1071983 RepID=A0ABY8AWL9_9GAMM|nr:hypothetical protein [Legionella cardiaca]WED44576.1 hypothetical protein PXX05_07250 [Legionella cardiaca]
MKFILGLLLGLFLLPIHATEPSEEAIKSQQTDQELCVQQRAKQCISTCENADDTNCIQMCDTTAKNECRYAGE